MTGASTKDRHENADLYTGFALVAGLVLFPLIWSSGVVGIGDVVQAMRRGSRTHWWYFHILGLIAHWIPFALIALALHKNRESWTSLGLDWNWFASRWKWFAALFVVLIASALLAPPLLYGSALPTKSATHFMAPVSALERLMIILVAITAGLTEEVIFRGFAFTRLRRWIRSPWVILALTVVSFLFIHGVPRNLGILAIYVSSGLAFGLSFMSLKYSRLHLLVLIHFLIDASMVFAP